MSKLSETSDLEAKFDYYLRALAPELAPMQKVKVGRWEIDRALPEIKLGIELNGGAGGGYGRRVKCHNCGAIVRATKGDGTPGREIRLPGPSHSGKGAERDAAKLADLTLKGWLIMVITSNQLDQDPHKTINKVALMATRARGLTQRGQND